MKEAFEQTAFGKGRVRHAQEGVAWQDQPICKELKEQDSAGFAIGQARKKLLESLRLPYDAAYGECLGAIGYAAAAAYWYGQKLAEGMAEREAKREEGCTEVGGQLVFNFKPPTVGRSGEAEEVLDTGEFGQTGGGLHKKRQTLGEW